MKKDKHRFERNRLKRLQWTQFRNTSANVKDEKENNICQCHHVQNVHYFRTQNCVGLGGRTKGLCACQKYVPKDNLKYLEWCYENAI